jgi:molybdopterin synthase catalytic subunit
VPPRIDLEVLLFASAREAVGQDRVQVSVTPGARAADVLDALSARYPALGAARRSLAVAVNHEVVGPEHPAAAGDEVALLPPVGGG